MKTTDVFKIIIAVVIGGLILFAVLNAYEEYQEQQEAEKALVWLQMNL